MLTFPYERVCINPPTQVRVPKIFIDKNSKIFDRELASCSFPSFSQIYLWMSYKYLEWYQLNHKVMICLLHICIRDLKILWNVLKVLQCLKSFSKGFTTPSEFARGHGLVRSHDKQGLLKNKAQQVYTRFFKHQNSAFVVKRFRPVIYD